MRYFAVGMNHKTAAVGDRERIALAARQLPTAVRTLCSSGPVPECMVVSTCNRVELWGASEPEADCRSLFVQFASGFLDIDGQGLRDRIFSYYDQEAIAHIFRVASSLDSLVIGEPQILGQVKEAFKIARQAGTIGKRMNLLMEKALSVAKKVRSETEIALSNVSVGSAAAELARKIYQDLSDKKTLIIGTGEMARLIAKHLRKFGAKRLIVVSRTLERALEFARDFEARAVEFGALAEQLETADIVITCTNHPNYLLTKSRLGQTLAGRTGRPLLVIDISVPRNVEPEVDALDDVFLYNIDDLQTIVHSNLKMRERELTVAGEIVEREARKFFQSLRAYEIGPLIAQLKNRVRDICYAELSEAKSRMPDLTPRQEKALELMVERIVNKACHPAIMALKRGQLSGCSDS